MFRIDRTAGQRRSGGWTAKKLAAVLARERKDAMLYRTLATLRADVPLDETLEQLEWQGAPKDRWLKWCEAVGSASLARRPSRFR